MWDENPSLVEDPEPGTPEDTLLPLVLVHDGGGTAFSYHCIYPPLERRILAIANPYFHNDRSWLPGGIPDMARNYIYLLRNQFGNRQGTPIDIILGGWSLGGIVALEMARKLHGDRWLRVAGIVMVDSGCPLAWRHHEESAIRGVGTQHLFTETTKPETKDKVLRSFAESTAMVSRWEMPQWGPEKPPPVVLLRAVESVPTVDGIVSRVDLARSDARLGWDSYRKDLIFKVIDIPGHHFNLFHESNVEFVSTALKEACEAIDVLSMSSAVHPS